MRAAFGIIILSAIAFGQPTQPGYGGQAGAGQLVLANTPLTTRGDLMIATTATPTLGKLGKGTQYQTLQGGATDPSYDAVHLDQATAVTGILPAANVDTALARLASPTFSGTVILGHTDAGSTGLAVQNSSGNNRGLLYSDNSADKGFLLLLSGLGAMVNLDAGGDSYINGGKLGVGNPAPAYELDVSKGVGISGTARFFDQTATTGATLVTITPGAAQTSASTILNVGGVASVVGLTFNGHACSLVATVVTCP